MKWVLYLNNKNAIGLCIYGKTIDDPKYIKVVL